MTAQALALATPAVITKTKHKPATRVDDVYGYGLSTTDDGGLARIQEQARQLGGTL